MTEFVLWMLLWPTLCDLSRTYRIQVVGKDKYSDEIIGIASLLDLVVWVVIGVLVYPK